MFIREKLPITWDVGIAVWKKFLNVQKIYSGLSNVFLREIVPCIFHIKTWFLKKICQWLATGRWISPCSPVSSINKTDPHDITEILLKVALNTITLSIVKSFLTLLDFHKIKKFKLEMNMGCYSYNLDIML